MLDPSQERPTDTALLFLSAAGYLLLPIYCASGWEDTSWSMATSLPWTGLAIWGGLPCAMNSANRVVQDGGIQRCGVY